MTKYNPSKPLPCLQTVCFVAVMDSLPDAYNMALHHDNATELQWSFVRHLFFGEGHVYVSEAKNQRAKSE